MAKGSKELKRMNLQIECEIPEELKELFGDEVVLEFYGETAKPKLSEGEKKMLKEDAEHALIILLKAIKEERKKNRE